MTATTQLVFRLPGGQTCEETLTATAALLIGRDPDPDALSAIEREGAPKVIDVRKYDDRTISANHVLVWRGADGGVCVRDLGSRNGTFVSAAPGQEVSLSGETRVVVDLAPARAAVAAKPPDATWHRNDEFATAIALAITQWLARSGLNGRAEVVESPSSDRTAPPTISLGARQALRIVDARPGATRDTGWDAAMTVIAEYVQRQLWRFESIVDEAHGAGFVLASAAIREAHEQIVEAAASGRRMIILGETGVGKGLLARCYHMHSRRRARSFEALNCAHIDDRFAYTRLFGAKTGAYTGCVTDMRGAVECANEGTLFLDEVGELRLDVQAQLLSFLDDGRYSRLGDHQMHRADVQLVCATNVDLRQSVREKKFREDLWYRLAGKVVLVPPLRERRDDITAFLSATAIGERDERTAWDVLDPEARALVVSGYAWPGNLREIDGFVRRIPTASDAGSIDLRKCQELLAEGSLRAPSRVAPDRSRDGWSEVVDTATQVFRRVRAPQLEPATAQDLAEYADQMLKPIFFARRLGFDAREVPRSPTPSFKEMGKALGCTGETVKAQLEAYVALRAAHADLVEREREKNPS